MENPPIRILQRPCHISAKNSSETIRPPAPVKTLEQREADYAAARRRIMGSDSAALEEDESVSTELKGSALVNGIGVISTSRQASNVVNSIVTTATPLMSIQAAPSVTNGINPDFRYSSTSTTGLSVVNGGQSRTAYTARQGLASVNVVQKLQQQPQPTGGTRPLPQPQRILTASTSSPSLFPQSRTTQPLPLFPPQFANTGLLPTPPGFNYASQNTTVNDASVGLHQSAALTLMQHFNLLQQYQQPLNGFHHLLSPALSHANTSINHLNFSSVGSLSNVSPKHAHPSTFN